MAGFLLPPALTRLVGSALPEALLMASSAALGRIGRHLDVL